MKINPKGDEIFLAAMRWYRNWNRKWIVPPTKRNGWDQADIALYKACEKIEKGKP